jgi:hypothetical protein
MKLNAVPVIMPVKRVQLGVPQLIATVVMLLKKDKKQH